jgi:uncharacterized protein (DUF2235 family)
MARRLVVCCDGTWDVPDQAHGDVATPTNVARLALSVDTSDPDQVLFYEAGVGTSADDRIAGGAFGYGLARNVRSGYRFLARTYRPGDQLFLFGFSRGAFTARSLAGLIRNCGILHKDDADQVDEAFALYRDRTSQTHPKALASQLFREMYSHPDQDIHFIGVWDTVGALGIPIGVPDGHWLSRHLPHATEEWGFHDTQLSSHVKFAYHALAIDEMREPFAPTLWTSVQPMESQTVEQVWFAGVHTEVGGGSDDPSLSDIALLWMAAKAKACGLALKPELEAGRQDAAGTTVRPDYTGVVDDSRKGLYRALGAYHRLEKLPEPTWNQAIASSAERRFRDHVHDYNPSGLRHYLDDLNVRVTQVDETTPASVPA